jgi:hypothetical protein
VIIAPSFPEVANMKIRCAPYENRVYRAELTRYEINIRRRKDDVSVSFTPSAGAKSNNGLSIPLDTATRIAHALLAAGGEDYKASWSVDESSRPAKQH